MPMPSTYQNASREWRTFLDDLKDRLDLASNNMAYTAVDAVFQVFRRRLTAQQGIDFAGALPAVLRAIFVKDWDVTQGPEPFADRHILIAEVQAVRRHHNLTPANAIDATAWAVQRCVDVQAFERVLATLPTEARAFWQVDPDAAP